MESIRKVRLAHHRDHKPIREIARDFNLSRNTIRKILRTGATDFSYERKVQPRPKLAPFKEQLAKYLTEDSTKPPKQWRTALLLFEQLQREGFDGGYDSVRACKAFCVNGFGFRFSVSRHPVSKHDGKAV